MITAERLACLTTLQERLGYVFHDCALLNCALMHPSYTHEAPGTHESYERLEFLGDAVLDLVVSAYLYVTYPACDEGQLSTLRTRVVSGRSLAAMAQRLGLGDFLLLGRGEQHSGGRHKPSLLAAAFEAVMAAIYLDGGLLKAQELFLRHGIPALEQDALTVRTCDYKGLLQQQALSTFGCLPTYRVVREEGPAHQKTFHVQLTLADVYSCMGRGQSKKAAEQQAARVLLERLRSTGA